MIACRLFSRYDSLYLLFHRFKFEVIWDFLYTKANKKSGCGDLISELLGMKFQLDLLCARFLIGLVERLIYRFYV